MAFRAWFGPLIGIFCICEIAFATDHQPWLGNSFEFQWRNSLLHQQYKHIASGVYNYRYSSNDFFLNTSISNAIFHYGLQLELIAASTRHQRANIDNVRATGKYLIFDDVNKDYVSLLAGLTLSGVSHGALNDVSSFHHGRFEGEFFLSVGKELTRAEDDWKSRVWLMSGFGLASQGSPWLSGKINFDYRPYYHHAFNLNTSLLVGLGKHWFYFHKFNGYGAIQHTSIDIGAKYTYFWGLIGTINFEYFYRIRARNFPTNVHGCKLEILTTFGI